ncbi:MAG: tyrosine-type recombinase/integrase [Clostridium sp.]
MSEDAVNAILKQPDTFTEKGKRDAFLLLFLYKTGARVQELVDIRLCDIQLGRHPKVTIHGKGAKTRSIPLRMMVQHLKQYLALFHPEEHLFSEQHLSCYTEPNEKTHDEDNVRQLVRKYGKQAREICKEVPENVHPHLFRHSWAMILYQNGVDLTLISQWLGHSNLETTLIYAHADTELKRKALEQAVPDDSPLKEHLNAARYKVSDEELLKRLCGLK